LKLVDLAERVCGSDHPDFASYLSSASALYYKLKEFDRARDFAQKSYSIRLKCLGPDHPDTKKTFQQLQGILELQRNNPKLSSDVTDSRMCAKCNKVLFSFVFSVILTARSRSAARIRTCLIARAVCRCATAARSASSQTGGSNTTRSAKR